MSRKTGWSFWPKQLALDTTARTNCASAGKTPAASSRRKNSEWRRRAPIYSKKEGVRCWQHTGELATEVLACHCACKRRNPIGGDLRVAPAASREVEVDFWKIYRTATASIFQITHKFSKEVENLQKWKLFNFSNSTTLLLEIFSNSASILKFEFGVHLSIWIISKLLQILYVNLKNFEYQSWSL